MNTAIATHHETNKTGPGKALTVALWVVQVLLTLMFLMAGGSKLAGAPAMVALFEAVGIGQWFRYVTGTLELLGAVLLVVPRANGLGAAILILVMLGAITAHWVVLHNSPAMPVTLLAGLVFVAWGRRAQILGFARRLAGGTR
jgi:uncharacterized membrane protein YphA (DoxX/SURF4 family)